MGTREMAHAVIDKLSGAQLEAFLRLFAEPAVYIEEIEPDEWDMKMLRESETDSGESVPLDDFVREMGFDPDELRA